MGRGWDITKEPPLVGVALVFMFLEEVCLLHLHLCHPNHKLILNNKDRKKDDNNKDRRNRVHVSN
jgi:hypothetical protein